MQQYFKQPVTTTKAYSNSWCKVQKLTGTTRVGGTLHAAMTQLYVLTSTGTPAAAMTCAMACAQSADLAYVPKVDCL